jgi:hypothetical protein
LEHLCGLRKSRSERQKVANNYRTVTWNGIISSNIYVVLNRNFHSNVNVLGRFYKQFLTSLYRSTVWYIFETRFETKIFASWTKATLSRIYFRNLSVHRSFLQYKSQCLEKVNVKYVIKRLWHEIFHGPWYQPSTHISPPASLSGLIWESWANTRADMENVM